MTKVSRFTDFADAVETAASTDRELEIDVDVVKLGRTARVMNFSSLRIWGKGNGSLVRPTSAMTAKDWLHFGNLSSQSGSENLFLEKFAFDPPANMKAGWAIRMDKCGRTIINNVDIGGNFPVSHMPWGGLWFNGHDKCEVNHSQVYAKHKAILLNGLAQNSWGADFTMSSDTKVQNHRHGDMRDHIPNSCGVHLGGGQGGIYLGGNIIYCGNGILIDTAMGKGFNREVFLKGDCIVDSCVEDGIRVMEGSVDYIKSSAWSASNGRGGGGNGYRIQPNQLPSAKFQFVGGRVFNHPNGDGIAASGGYVGIVGTMFDHNKNFDVHIANQAVRGGMQSCMFPFGASKLRVISPHFKIGPPV